MSKEAVDALEPFVALADARDAKYRARGGDPDAFPDTHPAYDISADDLPAGVWRKARTVYQALRSEAAQGLGHSASVPCARVSHRNEHSLFDKPFPALPILAEAIGCSETEARNGLRALVQAGYVIAPREPTNAMLVAYLKTYCEPTHAASVLRGAAKARTRWAAMAEAGNAMALSTRYIDDRARQFAKYLASAMSAGTAETNEDSAQGEARQRGPAKQETP